MNTRGRNRKLHAYMSGALTNVSSTCVVPPFCQENVETPVKFRGVLEESELQRLGKDIEKVVKAQYVRIKEYVKSLNVELYLPHEHSDPEHNADIAPETVHHVDRLRVTSSDFVIAAANLPSFGVGQELEIATQAGVPVIAYKHVRTRTSRMFLGNPILCDDFKNGLSSESESEAVIEYETDEEMLPKLGKRIAFLREHLDGSVSRRARVNQTRNFASRLAEFVEQGDLAETRKLSAKLGVPGTYVAYLRKRPENMREHFESGMPSMVPVFDDLMRRGYDFDAFSNPSLSMLKRIAMALNVSLGELVGEAHAMGARTKTILDYLRDQHKDATVTEFIAILNRTRSSALQQRKLRQRVSEILKELRSD